MKRLLEHFNIFAESDPTTAACTVAFVIGYIACLVRWVVLL